MSSQSGISVSPALESAFAKFSVSQDRALVLHIVNEAGELEHEVRGSSDLSADLEKAIASKLAPTAARYLAIRDDNGLAFVSFVPDAEKVRNKMLYASSTSSIFKQLGGSATFHSHFFWTDHSDISAKGWAEQQTHAAAAAPLTAEEQSLRTAVDYEASRMGSSRANNGLSTTGVPAKIGNEALSALKKVDALSGTAHLLLLKVDASETVQLEAQHQIAVSELEVTGDYFSKSSPRYGVLHHADKTTFVYVVPDGSSVRDRMLYASTRVSLLTRLREILTIDEVLETSDPGDIKPDSFSAPGSEPAAELTRPRFARPKRPGR